jgi:hypothetical protein
MLYMVTLCNIYHQYTPNVGIYTIHGSYGYAHVPAASQRRNVRAQYMTQAHAGIFQAIFV